MIQKIRMQKSRQFISAFKLLFSIVFTVLFITACGAKGRLHHPPEALKNIKENKEVVKKVTKEQINKEDSKNVN